MTGYWKTYTYLYKMQCENAYRNNFVVCYVLFMSLCPFRSFGLWTEPPGESHSQGRILNEINGFELVNETPFFWAAGDINERLLPSPSSPSSSQSSFSSRNSKTKQLKKGKIEKKSENKNGEKKKIEKKIKHTNERKETKTERKRLTEYEKRCNNERK